MFGDRPRCTVGMRAQHHPGHQEHDRQCLQQRGPALLPGKRVEQRELSDIAELDPARFDEAVRGRFYRPVKHQITARIDADVLDWLKSEGKGYQSRLNAILRREMLAASARRKKA